MRACNRTHVADAAATRCASRKYQLSLARCVARGAHVLINEREVLCLIGKPLSRSAQETTRELRRNRNPKGSAYSRAAVSRFARKGTALATTSSSGAGMCSSPCIAGLPSRRRALSRAAIEWYTPAPIATGTTHNSGLAGPWPLFRRIRKRHRCRARSTGAAVSLRRTGTAEGITGNSVRDESFVRSSRLRGFCLKPRSRGDAHRQTHHTPEDQRSLVFFPMQGVIR